MKRTIPFTMALALLFTGCAGPVGGPAGGGPENTVGAGPDGPAPAADLSSYALAQAVYPQFPAYPEPDGFGDDWEGYYTAQRSYFQAVSDLHADCNPALVRSNPSILDFAAKSAPLALAGHEGENTVYSPVSLWSALAMAAQCANEESRAQVLSALGMADMDSLTGLVGQVWRMLYTDDGRDALTLGNSIWLSSSAEGHYVQGTLDTLVKDYFSGVYAVPMGSPEADLAVTDWVSEQTHGLIGGGGPVVETAADTLAVLASSLYYRAGWTDEFYEENTREDTFTSADGQESLVDFMHSIQEGAFLLRDGYQAAYLPTRLGEMVFVLPDEGVTPESLLDDPDFLSGLNFNGAGVTCVPEGGGPDPTTAAHLGKVQWSVPKFDVNSNLDLIGTLKGLGVTDLLDPDKADLTNLTDIPAYIDEVFQLGRVKVDEEGVEAAAVTIMIAPSAASAPEEPEICVMDLDRPFLFVVRCQDLPLFVGIVNQID